MIEHHLRDLHQLQSAPAFAETAVEGLLTVEGMLKEALRYVPYCVGHRGVWSSHFTSIILDAASQVDSLWKVAAKLQAPATASDKLTIKDHFDRFGSLVARQSAVFFSGGVPATIAPFQQWTSGFSPPAWWNAYNKLKHDRFSNQSDATLEHAVHAVAALLLAIIYSGICDLALISARLLDTTDRNPWAFTITGLLRDITFDCHAKLESALFAHPLGIFGVSDCNLSPYWASGSSRFNIWWARNAGSFTSPKRTP